MEAAKAKLADVVGDNKAAEGGAGPSGPGVTAAAPGCIAQGAYTACKAGAALTLNRTLQRQE